MIKNCKECNKEFTTDSYSIKKGWGVFCSKKCNESNKRADMQGQRFGRLEVMGVDSIRKNKSGKKLCFYKVKCDCGKELTMNGGNLKRGGSSSCGCLRKEVMSLPHGDASINHMYRQYRSRSKKKNHSFDLSIEKFTEIILKDCFYCGESPKLSTEIIKRSMNGIVPRNGIDRVDNSLGYTIDNSVPCCKICNIMKMTLGVDSFLSHIEKICNHQENKSVKFPISYLTVVA